MSGESIVERSNETNFIRFTKKNILTGTLLTILYLIWNKIIGGIRQDHLVLIALCLVTYFAHEKTRKFITGFSIFVVFWIIYDAMHVLPNYEVSTVHIKQPYELEKSLFGITFNNMLLTPNEFFAIEHTTFLDIMAGLFYLNWIPIPLAFGVYLFFTDKTLFTKFSLVFLFANLIGFVIYYIYPAAPPWYVELYGFDLHIGVSGNTAGLSRFDEIVGVPVFANIYNKNANVLAAIPSLHSAYPVIVLFYAVKKGMGLIKYFFGLFMVGIWFSAVYSGHHYIIDVSLGVLVAIFTIVIFERLAMRKNVKEQIQKFVAKL